MPRLAFLAVLAIVLHLAIHLPHLDKAPAGFHQWRESDTATVAENFARRDFRFWLPQINLLGVNNTTQVGTELPLYTFATAAAYKTLGFSHIWPRLLSLLGALWMAAATAAFAKQLAPPTARWLAVQAGWLTLFCPMVFFYGARIQPDVWGIALTTTAATLFCGQRTLWRLILAGLCLGLAGAIKPTFFFVGLPLLLSLLRQSSWQQSVAKPANCLFAALAFLPALLWFRHARQLTDSYGMAYFYLGANWTESLRFLMTPAFYQNVFLTWPFELVIGLPMIPWFCIGIWRFRTLPGWPILAAWASGCLIVFALAAGHCATPHDYYYLPIVPCLCIIVAHGISSLRLQRWQRLSYALLVLVPLSSAIRVWPRFGHDPEFWPLREAATKLSLDSRVLAIDPMPGFQLYRLGAIGLRAEPQSPISQLADAYRQGVRYLLHTDKNGILSPAAREHLAATPVLTVGRTTLYDIKESILSAADTSIKFVVQP